MDKDPGASSTSAGTNDSTLSDVVDSDRDRPGRIGRRVILGILALFILASLADIFGLYATVTDSSPGYELTADFPRSTRAGMDARITVELRAVEKITGKVTVEVDHDYLDAFTSYAVSPAADGESSDGTVLVLDYDPPNETEFRLDVDGTASEDMVILSTGGIRVYVDDELVGSAQLKTRKAF
jgi:hypothetical protein